MASQPHYSSTNSEVRDYTMNNEATWMGQQPFTLQTSVFDIAWRALRFNARIK